ncbi:MAG: IS701 family transposase [Methanothrix sp.]|nr:IS701 family transposase [Methanothrix sp.]
MEREYKICCYTSTRCIDHRVFQYIHGIFLEKGRGNMSKYAQIVPGSSKQSLQHMISKSHWRDDLILAKLQKDVTKLIGDEINGSIHIDESSFPKQGTDSVGVARQYCGRLGKIDNCQVGVFLGYVNGRNRTLIDERLYLPQEWAEDLPRRREAGVPDEVVFKNKAQLAKEMILHARNNGVPFGWVGMDSFYGNLPWLRNDLDAEGITYMADIHRDTWVWLSLPKIGIPERRSQQGRSPTKTVVLDGEPSAVLVEDIAKQIPPSQWIRVFVRDTERGPLWTEIATIPVYPREDDLPGRLQLLILRRDEGTNNIKYQLSNAPLNSELSIIAKMSHSRYWIERAFEDGKGIAGLADYQIRTWTGWHHHMALSLLAMLALLSICFELGEDTDILTVQDIKAILEITLPRKRYRDKDLTKLINDRYKARHSAKMSHYKL